MLLFKLNTLYKTMILTFVIIVQLNQFVYIHFLQDTPGQGWGGYPGTLDDKVYIFCKFSLMYKLKKSKLCFELLLLYLLARIITTKTYF